MKGLWGRAVRFGIVGASLTILNYAIYVAGLRAGLHYLAAASLGWAAGIGVSYFANKSFTFGQGRAFVLREFILLVTGYGLQLGLGLLGLWLLIERAGFGEIAAYWLNLAVMAAFSFLYMQAAVFRKPAVSGTRPRHTQRSRHRRKA